MIGVRSFAQLHLSPVPLLCESRDPISKIQTHVTVLMRLPYVGKTQQQDCVVVAGREGCIYLKLAFSPKYPINADSQMHVFKSLSPFHFSSSK